MDKPFTEQFWFLLSLSFHRWRKLWTFFNWLISYALLPSLFACLLLLIRGRCFSSLQWYPTIALYPVAEVSRNLCFALPMLGFCQQIGHPKSFSLCNIKLKVTWEADDLEWAINPLQYSVSHTPPNTETGQWGAVTAPEHQFQVKMTPAKVQVCVHILRFYSKL